MAEPRDQPLLYPVLSLQMDPALRDPPGRGKGIGSIVKERLRQQQDVLASETRDIYEHRTELPTYSGLTHLAVRMFTEDSLAPTHTPDDLFSQRHGCRLVAPLPGGYLIEADVEQLPRLLHAIEYPIGYAVQADISRVSSLEQFDAKRRLRGRSVNELWNSARKMMTDVCSLFGLRRSAIEMPRPKSSRVSRALPMRGWSCRHSPACGLRSVHLRKRKNRVLSRHHDNPALHGRCEIIETPASGELQFEFRQRRVETAHCIRRVLSH